MKAYLESCEEVLKRQESDVSGLSSAEAGKRLAQHGPNKLQEGKKKSLLERFLGELADPMIIILIVAAVISGITAFYSGESFTDVIIILAVVIVNAVLGVYQGARPKRPSRPCRKCLPPPPACCATARSLPCTARIWSWATWCCWRPAMRCLLTAA